LCPHSHLWGALCDQKMLPTNCFLAKSIHTFFAAFKSFTIIYGLSYITWKAKMYRYTFSAASKSVSVLTDFVKNNKCIKKKRKRKKNNCIALAYFFINLLNKHTPSIIIQSYTLKLYLVKWLCHGFFSWCCLLNQ